ncbi:MAG: penicillin-binding protein 2, partial [Verrucomicrobiaceae bacterium]|nr:penicillin-binding protein 2 [Verrucomicrobiaceae bacterium]
MVVKYRFRLILFSLLVMVAFMTLVYRLYYLQIERNDEFKGKLPTTRHLKARVPGVRGEIKDRNGVVLVSNKPSFEVRINLKDVVDAKVRAMKIESHGKPVALPKIQNDKNEGGFARKMRETDIVAVMEEMVFEPLRKMKLAKEETDQERTRNQENLRTHFRTNGGAVPWVYRSDLTFEEFSRFAEHNLQLPGVFPEVRPTRQYIYDALACHVLGYVRLPDESLIPLSEQQKWKYAVWDDFGAAGVEKTMDSRLKGVPGVRVMLRNEKGNIVGEMPKEFVPPKKGNDVWLTLDARIQFIAETALRDANLGRAAAVVIDPNTGEVLAMASVPCYDPNKWVPKISDDDLKRYFTNPTNPMINRAIKKYAPGSTFKIATSFAGCLAHIQGSHFSCNGSVTYGNKAMKCWIADKGGSHGSIDLSDAL